MKRAIVLLFGMLQLITFEAKADTVIAIHGFLTDGRSLKPIKNALIRTGMTVVLWEYPSRKKCIEEHACDLLALLQKVACDCPGQPIHFVTHSVGALVLRATLNMPGCPQEALIGRAVLLAPPNQGSCLARRFCGVQPIDFAMGDRLGWQLMHYDPSRIACFGEFPSSMCVLVIAGTRGNKFFFSRPNDGFLTVEETWLNTPYYFQCFPVAHGNLLTNPTVLCCMRKFICGSGN